MLLKNHFLVPLFFSCLLFGSPANAENAPLRTGKDLAVFFAVNQYDLPSLWPNLQYPIAHAQAIAARLYDLYGFDTLVVRNPGLTDIFETLEVFRKRPYDTDAQLLLFFSGHGEFNDLIKMGYFVPRDVRRDDRFHRGYLEFPTLEREVASIPCRHILLAIDACFSGTFDDAVAMRGSGSPGSRPIGPEEDLEIFIEKQLQAQTRRVLTSGAKERTPERSQFAEQFLNALESGAAGEKPVLTLTELCGFLEKARPAPHFSYFRGDEIQSSFLFIAKNLANDNWTGAQVEFIEPNAAKALIGLSIPVFWLKDPAPASPAAKAGLRDGDVITAFLDPPRPLNDQHSFRFWSREAFSKNTGGTLRVLRKEAGRFDTLDVTLNQN